MTAKELLENRNKPVRFRDCVLILKAAKTVTDAGGAKRIKVLLKDRRVDSYVVAWAEEVKVYHE